MKTCPQCNRSYTDAALNFCLEDGTPLVTAAPPTFANQTATNPIIGSQPTLELPKGVRSGKRKVWPWVLAAVLVVGIGGIAVLSLVIYGVRKERENARSNRPPAANSTPSPKPSASPKSSASPSPSPSPDASATPDVEDPDEVVPIVWTTAASTFKTDIGRIYHFDCPPDGTPQVIWGSDIYTADSSICTAAVHAGVITLEDGGEVTVEFRPGRSAYGSTTRNGIKSFTYGEYSRSIVVR